MKQFHDEDMQRAWDEAIAAERELEKDPERKQHERLIRWASERDLSTIDSDKQVCRGGFLGLLSIKRKHYFSQDYSGGNRCWRWHCNAEWDWPNDRAR